MLCSTFGPQMIKMSGLILVMVPSSVPYLGQTPTINWISFSTLPFFPFPFPAVDGFSTLGFGSGKRRTPLTRAAGRNTGNDSSNSGFGDSPTENPRLSSAPLIINGSGTLGKSGGGPSITAGYNNYPSHANISGNHGHAGLEGCLNHQVIANSMASQELYQQQQNRALMK